MTSRTIHAGPDIEILDRYEAGTVPHFAGKYLSVSTYRRDGTPVATPVWFVEENGRLFIETDGDSGKAKRIRHDPRVLIASCNARGRVRGTPVRARAEILGAGHTGHVHRLMARKYRGVLIFIKPIRKLQRMFGKREVHPVVLAITPEGVH